MVTKRQVFYSFHYIKDYWRAAMVRSIGAIEGNKPAADNEWETVVKGGDEAIKNWIKEQMKYRSCVVVLVGRQTANRKWINFEIIEGWNAGLGIVGIRIHGLKDSGGFVTLSGENPFDYISLGNGKKMSDVVKCYNPKGAISKEKYDWISRYISAAVEEAIKIRNDN